MVPTTDIRGKNTTLERLGPDGPRAAAAVLWPAVIVASCWLAGAGVTLPWGTLAQDPRNGKNVFVFIVRNGYLAFLGEALLWNVRVVMH